MGAAFLQKVYRHLLVQRLSHVGQVSAFFPESKFTAAVCTANVYTLSWEHRGITHTVMGNIPYDEIMKIAEGIR